MLHAKALHGNPYDGHTLGPVITDLEKLTGVAVRRIHGDKGYRGHNYPNRFRVWISGQVRRVTKVIRREMRPRAAVEPVIGHLKDDHRMRRNYLKGRDGDRINAVLAAAGYNFSLLLRWFEELLRVLLLIICRSRSPRLCSASLALRNILHGKLKLQGIHQEGTARCGDRHQTGDTAGRLTRAQWHKRSTTPSPTPS